MWTMLIALIVLLAALALAVKLLRTTTPAEQVQRRLKIVQLSEFAPGELESAADVRKVERLSRYPWLNRILTHVDVAARLRRLLQQADTAWTVESLLMMCVFGWAGTACLLFLRIWSVVPAALLATAVIPLPWLYLLNRRALCAQRTDRVIAQVAVCGGLAGNPVEDRGGVL